MIILYFGLSINNKNSNINGLIIGLALTMCIFTGFYLSGGSMNLVRSLPPAVYEAIFGGNTTAIKQIWIYIIGPIIGVILELTYLFFYLKVKILNCVNKLVLFYNSKIIINIHLFIQV